MTFVGLDLHKRYITACALGASGALIAEIRQLATTIETVLDWLHALPAVVAMEATRLRRRCSLMMQRLCAQDPEAHASITT